MHVTVKTWLGVVIILIVAFIVAFFVYQKNVNSVQNNSAGDVFYGWKNYQNKSYGFEFKYPGGWDLFENKELLLSGQKVYVDLGKFSVDVWDTSIYSLDQLKQLPTEGITPQSVQEKTITLDGVTGPHISYVAVSDVQSGTKTRKITLAKNDLVYVIVCTEKCDQILSTFKFIN
jgi:hypothetical protein